MEKSYSANPEKIVEVKDKWVKVRVTMSWSCGSIVQRCDDRKGKSRIEWRSRIEWSWRGTWAAPDWRVRAGPWNKPTHTCRFEIGACTAWWEEVAPITMSKKKEECWSVQKARYRDGLLLHENGHSPECSSNLRRIDNLHCGEGRQTPKHHEQCGPEEGSWRALDNWDSSTYLVIVKSHSKLFLKRPRSRLFVSSHARRLTAWDPVFCYIVDRLHDDHR